MRCCEKVFDGMSIRGHQCTRNGKVERNGNWYCGQHDPEAAKARREAQNAKWQAERAAEAEKRRARDAEAAEQKRRAEMYPELLSVLREANERPLITEGVDWWIRVRAVLAKATGEQP